MAMVAALIVSLFVIPATADTPEISVILNGEELTFDVPPQIIDNRTMVPMRAIFEALGAWIEWVDDEELIEFLIHIFDDIAYELGAESSDWVVDSPLITGGKINFIVDNRTLVPLRAISEALDAAVEWDEHTRTVTITADNIEEMLN